MKDKTNTWLAYANENLDVANLTLKHSHLNASLQNAQQAVEKYLKAVIVERDLEFRRTHSIRELVRLLAEHSISINISDDEMDLMDTIYLPSKYPIYSALPNALPERTICEDALKIAENIREAVIAILDEA